MTREKGILGQGRKSTNDECRPEVRKQSMREKNNKIEKNAYNGTIPLQQISWPPPLK